MTSMTKIGDPVTGRVDTHGLTHHAAVIDQVGRHVADCEFPTTPAGYRQLSGLLGGHGQLEQVGVEGTGAFGAAPARRLHCEGVASGKRCSTPATPASPRRAPACRTSSAPAPAAS